MFEYIIHHDILAAAYILKYSLLVRVYYINIITYMRIQI